MKSMERLIFLVFLILVGCSSGGTGGDVEEVVQTTKYSTTTSQLLPLSLKLPQDLGIVSIVDNPRYVEVGKDSTVQDSEGHIHMFYGGKELRHRYFDGSEWLEEVVDDYPRTGKNATVAIDLNGVFHVLYQSNFDSDMNQRKGNLKYAFGYAGHWTIQNTPISYQGLEEHRGALIARINGGLAFAFEEGSALKLATYDHSAWSIALVDEDMKANSGGLTSIEIIENQAQELGIVYFRNRNDLGNDFDEVVLTRESDTSWRETIINVGRISEPVITAAIGSNNRTTICFPSGWPQQIICSEETEQGWSEQVIYSLDSNVQKPELKADKNGFLHLVYLAKDQGNTVIRYANNKSGSWVVSSFELLDYYPVIDSFLNLEVISSDSIRVLFKDDRSLEHGILDITRSNGLWEYTSTKVELELTNSGAMSAIALDDKEAPIIFFSRMIDNVNYVDAHLAIKENQAWKVSAPIEGYSQDRSINRPPVPSRMITDQQGSFHLAMTTSEYLFQGTYYASNKTGLWAAEVLPDGYIASSVDIKLDSDNSSHIAYLTKVQRTRYVDWRVRYATNKSGVWQEQDVYVFENTNSPDYDPLTTKVALNLSDKGEVTILAHKEFDQYEPLQGLVQAKLKNSEWEVSLPLQLGSVSREFRYSIYQQLAWSYPSIGFDAKGAIHMVYNAAECTLFFTCSQIGIGYSTNKSGEWVHNIIDAETYGGGTGKGEDPVLAIDGENVFVAYYHDAYGEIRLTEVAQCSNTAKVYYVADSNVHTFSSPSNRKSISASLAISTEKVHMSYRDNPNGNLKYFEVNKSSLLRDCDNEQQEWFQKKEESYIRSVQILNDSATDREIENLYIYDTNQFYLESESCSDEILSTGQTCEVQIRFDATLAGAHAFSIAVDFKEVGSDNVQTIGLNQQINVFR